jgi:hypothetical protein
MKIRAGGGEFGALPRISVDVTGRVKHEVKSIRLRAQE